MSVPAQAGRVLPGDGGTRMPSPMGPILMWGLFILTFLGACGPPSPKTTRRSPSPTEGKEVPKMELTSSAFANGQPIPKKYTGAGANVSPPLTWSDPPEGTRSLALICDDPDAPSAKNPRPEGPWVHWVIYNIPADVRSLPEGLPRQAKLEKPAGALKVATTFPATTSAIAVRCRRRAADPIVISSRSMRSTRPYLWTLSRPRKPNCSRPSKGTSWPRAN